MNDSGESQGNGNGQTAGANSAITSWKKSQTGTKATYGGTLEATHKGKLKIIPRASKLGFKKNGFAT
jgi:hypothetical protein